MRLIPIKLNNRSQHQSLPSKKIQTSFIRNVNDGFFNDRMRSWGYVVCFISTAIQVLLIIFSWSKLPSEVPLFYSLPWGNDVLTKPIFLWVLPILTLAFAFVNFLIIKSNIHNRFISNILVMTLIVVSFMNAFGVIKIISLLT